jgi:hypothetical protein
MNYYFQLPWMFTHHMKEKDTKLTFQNLLQALSQILK